LSGALLLPGAQLPLNIFEPRYLAMFDDTLSSSRVIGIIQPALEKRPADSKSTVGDLCADRLSGPNHVIWRDGRRPLRDHAGRYMPFSVCSKSWSQEAQALPRLLRSRRFWF
jgi:hypothetical protein